MSKKKSIYLSPGCNLSTINKVINVNLSSEGILILIINTIKSCYSPETQQEIFETNLDDMSDLSPSQISKLKENVAVPKPDTLVVVSCQFGESEVNELGLSLKLTVYFVMSDTKGSNHFMSMKIQLSANIWDGEERFMKLEEELGEQFFKNYEIQLIFDDNSQSKVELEVFQTLDMPARLQFLPQWKTFSPTVGIPPLPAM